MKISKLHQWDVSAAQAKEIQMSLARMIVTENKGITPHLIAGVDMSAPRSNDTAWGAAVVLSYPRLDLVEVEVVEAKMGFPYIPGLLSFRECPVILAACEKLNNAPDLVLVDGQGLAHPRRCGFASHLGLFLDLPTIGCAKSLLCGSHGPVEKSSGSHSELIDGGEIVGVALRTKSGAKPIYVSIGHKIDLSSALYWVMECCRNYRLPEPVRLAHLAASGSLRQSPARRGKLSS